MKHKVCYVTSTRADYNPLRKTVLKLNSCKEIDFKLVITGMHLSPKFGNTYRTVLNDGYRNYDLVKTKLGNGSKQDMALAIANTITKFIEYFTTYKPDLLVLYGDRFEIFAVATAASVLGIKIAHISGGDITEGAIDDIFRNSITHMSSLHFPGNEDSRRRIIGMGKDSQTVFNVGEPGIENIINIEEISRQDLSIKLSFDLTSDFAIVTYHPETVGNRSVEKDMKQLISAMNRFDMNYIITKSNADAGGLLINKIWERESKKHNNWLFVSSLSTDVFINCLRRAKMMIGNSSSGIVEAPTVGIPTVNIGDRQKGRMLSKSVICCKCNTKEIKDAMKLAYIMKNRKYYLYGDGNSSDKILEQVLNYLDRK